MALDKQRILSELGSVVNQLQSADCGCMGKLFSNPGQGSTIGSPLPTCGGCRRGCCHGHGYNQGYSAPCAGEPCSYMNSMNGPCMGHCNPPKLYADTYNYLNENLMQPTMKEVYNDLKSITPANTVMNNPMASQLGLAQGNVSMQPQNNVIGMNQSPTLGGTENLNTIENLDNMSPGYSLQMGNHNNTQQMGTMQNIQRNGQTNHMGQSQPMVPTSGMGAQIANMFISEGGSKNKMSGQIGQLKESIQIDAHQSPHGKVGVTPLSPQTDGAYKTDMGMTNMSYGQQPNSNLQYPVTQHPAPPNMYSENIVQNNSMLGNMTHCNNTPGSQAIGQVGNMGQVNRNPGVQQMSAPNPNTYGQHSSGITKFKEMFPGLMQGDLGFDPMAIAIQMNPANQQKAAMNTMQNLMTGNKSIKANESQPMHQEIMQSNNLIPSNQISEQQKYASPILNQQQMSTQQTQQYQLLPQYHPHQLQQRTDPNTGAIINSQNHSTGNESFRDPNIKLQMSNSPDQSTPPTSNPVPATIKEPIFPVDISRSQAIHTKPQMYYQYNMLGQPVEMMPAKMYRPPESSLPQTLSPQPLPTKLREEAIKYNNVKNTVSKTSIVGNKPVGRTPSRSQLQQVYNQYKGSQSFTQQNINPPQSYGSTYSEGNVAHRVANPALQAPVEKVGGDTIVNNTVFNNNKPNKVAPTVEQIGDVPTTKPCGDSAPDKVTAMKQTRCRNGLQDMVYTSYPTSAAWSFHGNNRAPFSDAYRFKSRA
ncbi:uncharacterized protein LOC131848921 [Achroia grisella]|uniref:uncharacterized protein LOC131848921 n=1 Tax=Achroia grisella TaxID=688607 RepID=UPI0027D32FEB|nr:uncharacterized protein LOC131848921 [Achroia grisella]